LTRRHFHFDLLPTHTSPFWHAKAGDLGREAEEAAANGLFEEATRKYLLAAQVPTSPHFTFIFILFFIYICYLFIYLFVRHTA
jgi:hypothetical protein